MNLPFKAYWDLLSQHIRPQKGRFILLATMLLVSIAGVNVLLNAWLIPLYSWRGAAIATIVSDGLLGVVIWATVWFLGRYGRRIETPGKTPSPIQVG